MTSKRLPAARPGKRKRPSSSRPRNTQLTPDPASLTLSADEPIVRRRWLLEDLLHLARLAGKYGRESVVRAAREVPLPKRGRRGDYVKWTELNRRYHELVEHGGSRKKALYDLFKELSGRLPTEREVEALDKRLQRPPKIHAPIPHWDF
jgi:hypothetical protein